MCESNNVDNILSNCLLTMPRDAPLAGPRATRAQDSYITVNGLVERPLGDD